MKKNTVKITIPAKLPYLPAALAFSAELSRLAGFDKSSENQIRVALEEIITNVIRHGFGDVEKGDVEIICEDGHSGISFIVYDRGMPFDPSKLPEYSPEKATLDSGLEGLGTFLAKKNMDEIVYRNLGREGYAITLTKNLKSSHVEKMFAADELERYNDAPRSREETKLPEYTIREFHETEAIEISKCAYKAYGYTYDDYIYYPEKITSYNKDHLMYSLVAATDENIVMGHCAVKKNLAEDIIGELGVAFVKPEYRGGGIFVKMTEALFSKCREIGLAGTYARSVTSHTISQKICFNFNMKACAILFAAFPETNFKGLAETAPQRESGIVFYFPFAARETYNVYPPARHRAAVEKIYANLGISVKISSAKDVAGLKLSRNTISSSTTHNVLNSALIEISSYAPDTAAIIKHKVKQLCVEKIDVIYMHLDIENPHTESFSEEFENSGFFFAGILPCALNGYDALILQYLNNVNIDADRINIFSEDGREILKYINSVR